MSKNRISGAAARFTFPFCESPAVGAADADLHVVFASVNINPVTVAVIAFGMNFAAYVSEMFRAAIESIDKGQRKPASPPVYSLSDLFLHYHAPGGAPGAARL